MQFYGLCGWRESTPSKFLASLWAKGQWSISTMFFKQAMCRRMKLTNVVRD